jgi:hypothetical protein
MDFIIQLYIKKIWERIDQNLLNFSIYIFLIFLNHQISTLSCDK